MKKLRNILDFYIFSNIHVALASFCLTKITLLEIGISENTTALFVFLATLVSYNFIRFLRLEKEINWFQKWSQAAKSNLYILTAIGLLFIIYFTFQLRLKAIFILVPFLIFTIFYVFPIQKYAIRNIAGLKLFLIAISWAGVTVLFPLVQNFIIPRAVDYIIFLQRFLFIVVITIPFDIRDLNIDSEKLKTLPQQFGIKKSKRIGLLFLMLFLGLAFFKNTFHLNSILILIVIAIISGLFLIKSTVKQHKYYSAFFGESIPVIWFVLILF